MKRIAPHRLAFTLIEMITVIAVIVILAGLTIGALGFVQRTAAVKRATGEIAALGAAVEDYKADNGSIPRHTDESEPFDGEIEVTDGIDPRKDGDPQKGKYRRSSLFLYTELTGDKKPSPEKPDGIPDGKRNYIRDGVPQGMMSFNKERTEVNFLKDPFGFSYGYSTAALKQEIKYRKEVRNDPSVTRDPEPNGYNGSGADIWSTGGHIQADKKGQEVTDQAKWVRSW